MTPSNVLRRRPRTQEVRRGAWSKLHGADVLLTLREPLRWSVDNGAVNWSVLEDQEQLAKRLKDMEVAQTDANLILVSRVARRMKKPQPWLGPLEAPLRNAILLMDNDDVITTGWEEWTKQPVSSQIRALPTRPRQLAVMLFGKDAHASPPAEEPEPQEAADAKWNRVPRELRLALRRVHVNLGHARLPDMLRCLRISRASEAAIRACKLFRCKECPRRLEPKIPRTSKLPVVDEFGIIVGLDVLEEKCADGVSWIWLNILDLATTFQVCAVLDQSHRNPTSAEILNAFTTHWASWAGMPEKGVVVDQTRYFMGEFAKLLEEHGCEVNIAAKASPWHIGAVERHGGTWKSIWRRVAWSQQISGVQQVRVATAEVNKAKNALSRRSGFSPEQWVLGRSVRVRANLLDDGEVARIGAQAAALTPGARFYKQLQLRTAAREACVRTANSDVLRRAELRKVRPSRGPFPVGSFVFYYDTSGADAKHGPHCWRGIARVLGHDGSHTVWLSHRGILVAASPEHLSLADDDEVKGWMVTSRESELIDATPSVSSNTFLDLRRKLPPPPDGFTEEMDDTPEIQQETDRAVENVPRPSAVVEEEPKDVIMSPSIAPAEEAVEPEETAEAREKRLGKEWSERDRKRVVRSSEFFKKKEQDRKSKKAVSISSSRSAPSSLEKMLEEAAKAPVDPEEDPELEGSEMVPFDLDTDDYHQAQIAPEIPPLETTTARAEAEERAAKRLRTNSPKPREGAMFSYMVSQDPNVWLERARSQYMEKEHFYSSLRVSLEEFMFGVERNVFDDRLEALHEECFSSEMSEANPLSPGGSLNAAAKKGRKEVQLKDLSPEIQELFTGEGGSDGKEWQGWQDKDACDVLSLEDSLEVRRQKPDLIVPTRWVRANKAENTAVDPYKAKSRLVVQGFKDKSLGRYRRDAPTASQIAESILLCLVVYFRFILISKDVKNGYFCGKPLEREIFLEQPRGGLPGLQRGVLLKAKKAIYGFAEAARLFWLALREHLISDGWVESVLEPALFYHRNEDGGLNGVLGVTHVDDIEGGVEPGLEKELFANSSKALDFATNHRLNFTFRGRELSQQELKDEHGQVFGGHIDVSMRNCFGHE